MAEHTPGPWRHEWREPDCTVWAGEDEHVASIYGDGSVENATANARLIAAAPDLLEALKEVLIHFSGTVAVECCGLVVDKARAAIANAEGAA